MRSSLLPLLLVGLVSLSSCCRNCDLTFLDSELELLNYDVPQSETRIFKNQDGQRISYTFNGTNIEDGGRTCGGFGPPPDDFCSTNARQTFTLGNGVPNIEVILTKSRGDTAPRELDLKVEMGRANIYFFLEDGAIPQSRLDQAEALTVNGVDYDDVFTYFFDPNADCRDPSGPFCVDEGDIVGVDFSLSAGLLRFQVHRGLQTSNDVYTWVD